MLSVIFFVSCIVCPSFSATIKSSGPSGQLCGNPYVGYEKCLSSGQGSCLPPDKMTRKQKCQCNYSYKKNVQGDGGLACYKQNKVYAFIRSEPYVKTYDNRTYDFELPCRYMATHFHTDFKIKKEVKGKCNCEIYTWNRKFRGKIYPHGYDWACEITRYDGFPDYSFSQRQYGEALYGQYTFNFFGADHFDPNGPWREYDINYLNHNLHVESTHDLFNNMAVNTIRQCGVRLDFRPFDKAQGGWQKQPNGLAWAVNCANDPDLQSDNYGVVSGPKNHGGVPMEQIIANGLDARSNFFFNALSNPNAEQNQPDAPPACDALRSTTPLCDSVHKRNLAMDRCRWIFKAQHFMKCVDRSENANYLIEIMNECISTTCDPNRHCSEFLVALDNIPRRCKKDGMKFKVEHYRKWVDGEMCTYPVNSDLERSPSDPEDIFSDDRNVFE